MGSPLQLPGDLLAAPLGVSWATIGQSGSTTPSSEVNAAALLQICQVANQYVMDEANQDLVGDIRVEQLQGPGHRIGILNSGMARFITSFGPVVRVVAGVIAPVGVNPLSYTLIPPGNAYPEEQPLTFGQGSPYRMSGGMNAILINPAYMGWGWGRMGTMVTLAYLSGWANTELTASVAAGVMDLPVADVVGLAGTSPWITDSGNTEQVQVVGVTPTTPAAWSATATYYPGQLVTYQGATYQALLPSGPTVPATAQAPMPTSSPFWVTPIEPSGPGTLTLAAPTQYAHTAPVLVTTAPWTLRWACALYAKAEALQRGLATVSVPGTGGKAASADDAITAAMKEAKATVRRFARIY